MNEHYIGFDIEVVGTMNPVDQEPVWALTIRNGAEILDARYIDGSIPLHTVFMAVRLWVDDRLHLDPVVQF